MNTSEEVPCHAISARHGAWLHRLQSIAGSAAVFMAIAASSVVAASEALHEAHGNAVLVFCDAFVRPHGAMGFDAEVVTTDRGLQ